MAKARITVTYVYEYEIKPENYENCETDNERIDIDLDTYRAEPSHLDLMDAKSMTINGVLVEDAV